MHLLILIVSVMLIDSYPFIFNDWYVHKQGVFLFNSFSLDTIKNNKFTNHCNLISTFSKALYTNTSDITLNAMVYGTS